MDEIVFNTAALNELLRSPSGPVAAYLGRLGQHVASAARVLIGDYDAVDLGRLRGSINHVVAHEGSDLTCFVGTNVGYALPVHNGRRAGAAMPPEEPILEWMHHKRIAQDASDTERRGIAFVIRRKIAAKGIEPKPYLTAAIPAARSAI